MKGEKTPQICKKSARIENLKKERENGVNRETLLEGDTRRGIAAESNNERGKAIFSHRENFRRTEMKIKKAEYKKNGSPSKRGGECGQKKDRGPEEGGLWWGYGGPVTAEGGPERGRRSGVLGRKTLKSNLGLRERGGGDELKGNTGEDTVDVASAKIPKPRAGL